LVVGGSTDSVYKYNSDGTYANISFSVAGQDTSTREIEIDSMGNFWVVGTAADKVYKYTPAPSSTLASRFNDVDLGVMQIDSETNQAAMVKPLKVREPINDDEAASLNTVKTQANSIATTVSDETIDNNGIKIESSSLAADGYVKYSDGRIEQWGVVTISGSTEAVVFPTPFLTACWNVQITTTRASDTGGIASPAGVTVLPNLTGFTATTDSTDDSFYWRAIGN